MDEGGAFHHPNAWLLFRISWATKKGGTPIGVPAHFIESKNIKRSVADQGRALLRGEKA